MPLPKQNVNVNFLGGLDQKTDPKQVKPGKFLSLVNSVFTKLGRLTKRYGFKQLATLPNVSSTYVTTFNGNLTAIGDNLEAFSSASGKWIDKGSLQPVELDVLPLIRNSLNQTQASMAVASNGLVCVAYTENGGATSPQFKFLVNEPVTGQNIIPPTVIANADPTLGTPKVYCVGNYFVVVYSNVVTATSHLKYIAINAFSLAISASVDISATYTPASTVSFDGCVANDSLYLAWAGSAVGGDVKMTYIDQTLTQHNTIQFTGHTATHMNVCADQSSGTPVLYVAFYDSVSKNGYVFSVNQQLNTLFAPTIFTSTTTLTNITASADLGKCTIFEEVAHNYSYDASIPTHFIQQVPVSSSGTVGSTTVLVRSLGLASKSFVLNDKSYFFGIYFSDFQPTYFLYNASDSVVVSRLAYGNAGPYYITGLCDVVLSGLTTANFAYLYQDQIQAVNKDQGDANPAGIYSQLGVNMATYDFTSDGLISAEIGGNLNLTGGFLWMYDGFKPVESNFFVWPDNVEVTTSGTGGHLSAQTYFYQTIYRWSDNQGNVFRSAPSIPVSVTTTGSTSTNTINVPTLRLTYKGSDNPVTIEVYRWSTAQENYYLITPPDIIVVNDPTVDSIFITDGAADATILGNELIYTTGGVVEDLGPPSFSSLTLYKSRLFGVTSEDKNLLWYSKQVIENTPVEMNDLFTIYVAPTTGAQGSTGPITALSAMDDKLIIFKKDAIYYLTGTGPDNTGANNDFSDPVFITSTVGCINQKSIVFIPNGLMFQSDKGIWLLGRDLSTTYIGSEVENFNKQTVVSALNIPGTNQVRFSMSGGTTIVFNYFVNQWGEFRGISPISSTLFQGLHTYIDAFGRAFQENPGSYLDGSLPVLMSFTTGWMNLAGLQGYERFYYMYLMGTYFSPHRLAVSFAYEYDPSPSQNDFIDPLNYVAPWGGDQTWGQSTPWGGPQNLEQYQIHAERQTTQAFQITVEEVFDPSYGTIAGEGLNISGFDLIVGLKKGYRPLGQAQSVGGGS